MNGLLNSPQRLWFSTTCHAGTGRRRELREFTDGLFFGESTRGRPVCDKSPGDSHSHFTVRPKG